jgi:hypothetical protein
MWHRCDFPTLHQNKGCTRSTPPPSPLRHLLSLRACVTCARIGAGCLACPCCHLRLRGTLWLPHTATPASSHDFAAKDKIINFPSHIPALWQPPTRQAGLSLAIRATHTCVRVCTQHGDAWARGRRRRVLTCVRARLVTRAVAKRVRIHPSLQRTYICLPPLRARAAARQAWLASAAHRLLLPRRPLRKVGQ